MPPRYGRPPGFGGAYDDPTRGRFQPGSEVGVVDPNDGRFWAIGINPGQARHYSATGASHVTLHTASAPHHYPER